MVQRAGKWMAKFESSEAFKQNAFKWCGCYQRLISRGAVQSCGKTFPGGAPQIPAVASPTGLVSPG